MSESVVHPDSDVALTADTPETADTSEHDRSSGSGDDVVGMLGDRVYFAILLACFLPLLVLHFRQLWLYEHYQYFPLLLLAFPVVIDRIRGMERTSQSGKESWKWPMILAGLVVLALATLGWSPNLAAVGFVITSGGVLWHFYQRGQIGRFFSCWFVLFFLIKLPLNMDVDLIFWLQGITSKMASRLVDFVGINHFLAGHSIKIADADFAVEEACSGIQSLFSLLAMTALILALFKRSIIHSLLLLAAAVFWACMINTIRVSTVVVAFEKMGIDLTQDRPHEILGLVLFAAAIGLTVCSDRLILFFTADDTAEGDDDEIEHFTSLNTPSDVVATRNVGNVGNVGNVASAPSAKASTPGSSSGRWRLGILIGFVVLAVLQLGVLVLTSRGLQSINPDDPRLANVFSEDTLPKSSGRWKRKAFETQSRSLTNYQGRNSAQWAYESDLGNVTIGVDYPFLGWHELTGCYIAEGCQLNVREVIASDNTVRATITAPSGATGRLIFSEFRTNGQQLLPLGNDAGTVAYWRSRLQSALIRQFASFQRDAGSFQVQLLYFYDQPPSEATETELLDLHRSMAEEIVAVVKEAVNSDE